MTADKTVIETAKADHSELKEAVIRAAKLWKSSKGEPLACRMLENAVSDLFNFEQRYKGILAQIGQNATFR